MSHRGTMVSKVVSQIITNIISITDNYYQNELTVLKIWGHVSDEVKLSNC